MLFRSHGESIVTVNRVIGGHRTCTGLSPLGRTQAERLRDRWLASSEFTADVLMSIVQPSAVVSDQYANSAIGRVDGGKTIGRILNEEGDKLLLAVNPFDFSVQLSINRSDILSIDRAAESPMPVGLINSLNAQEVADLIAYLVSGANPKDKLYSK